MNIDVVLGLLVGLVVGLGLALVIIKMRGGNNDTEAIKKLEEEHEKYRKEVDGHFVKTADLFKGLTDQYRDVYKHMAEGSDQLCSEEAKTLQTDLAATGLLAQVDEVVTDADKSEIEGALEPEEVVKTDIKEETSSDVQAAKDHVEASVEKPADVATDEIPEESVEKNTEKKETSSEEDEFPLASEVELPSELAEEKKK